MSTLPDRVKDLWNRLVDVPQDRFPDAVMASRARTVRALMAFSFALIAVGLPVIFLAMLLMGSPPNPLKVLSTLAYLAFNLLLYWLAGRGARGMAQATFVSIPPMLVAALLAGWKQDGIYDSNVYCCFSALVLAVLLRGARSVYPVSVAATGVLLAIGVGTVRARTGAAAAPYLTLIPTEQIWISVFCDVTLVGFITVLVLLQERVHQRLLKQSVESARAYREEAVKSAALVELDRVKTTFFNSISHEFRTPITLALGAVEEALSDRQAPLPEAQRGRLIAIRRNEMRLLRLVNTLLAFARMEAGRHRASYEPVDLSAFTTELCSEFRSAMDRAGLRLVVDCPPLPEPIYVDREMWEKIILNLLSNALKFTLEGEVEVTLRPLPGQPAQVELKVHDTGVGIDEQDLPRLFQHFQQVHAAKARTREGSGIGLALVEGLLRLHGGCIRASSVLNKGTTFTVTLPLGCAHLPPDQIVQIGQSVRGGQTGAYRSDASTLGADPYVEEALHWLPPSRMEDAGVPQLQSPAQGTPPLLGEDARGDRPHVVVADDNRDMRTYLARLLGQRFSVSAVADGQAVLAAAQARRTDLVLSDVMMPGLSGFDVVSSLRKDPVLRTVPVVLLSARAEEDSAVKGMAVGADDYLVKPFSPRELLARVSAHVEMNRLRREAADAREEFVRVVSHELRGPLSIIKGYTQMVQVRLSRSQGIGAPGDPGSSNPGTATAMEFLPKMERAIERMEALVNDLIDLSRIDAGKLELKLEPCDLRELCVEAVDEQEISGERSVTLKIPEAPAAVMVHGDENRLCQVLSNLLGNAFKYGEGKQPVVLSLEVLGKEAEICVRDEGPGIAPEHLTRIFDRFYTVARTQGQGRGAGGLGLGLYICRQLVERHGGTIRVESEAGQGSSFYVRLPLYAVARAGSAN